MEQEGWLNEGGGQALFESVLAPHGVLPLIAGHTGVQMGGWFSKPLRTPQDLRGVRIRIAGFAGRVLTRVGAMPVNLPLGQIVSAFAEGKIDAADVVGPRSIRLSHLRNMHLTMLHRGTSQMWP